MITTGRWQRREGVRVSSKGKEMEIVEKAIEVQATIDKSRQLILDEELPVTVSHAGESDHPPGRRD